MMHGAHIGGQRAGVLLELVDGVDPRRVLLVGVDVAKATWLVVASNLVGEVMVDGVGLVADRAGLAELERLIAATRVGAFPWLLDMLRNEDPVSVTIADDAPGSVLVQTSVEPAGIGDETGTDSRPA
jgi:hypothetical protein